MEAESIEAHVVERIREGEMLSVKEILLDIMQFKENCEDIEEVITYREQGQRLFS
jgi:hypothetical protein